MIMLDNMFGSNELHAKVIPRHRLCKRTAATKIFAYVGLSHSRPTDVRR
jgi:hypothetical protein